MATARPGRDSYEIGRCRDLETVARHGAPVTTDNILI